MLENKLRSWKPYSSTSTNVIELKYQQKETIWACHLRKEKVDTSWNLLFIWQTSKAQVP